jgi:outer membrane receptor protein involved in Fe transport
MMDWPTGLLLLLPLIQGPPRIAETVTVSAPAGQLRISTPASATVLDAEAVASAAALTVDDLLKTVPGFSLFRRSSSRVANPTTQGVTLRGLSASGASRTLVLADEVPLNDPVGGWVYWSRVPAAAIERIEVTRGAVGDVYGSDAMGGAIRIETASRGARVVAEGGEDGTARLSAFAGHTVGNADVRGAVEGSTTDGYVTVAPESRGVIDVAAESTHRGALLGAGAPVTRSARVDLHGNYFRERRGNGTPLQRNETEILQGASRLRGPALGGSWSGGASAGSQTYDQTFSAVSQDRVTERLTSAQHVTADSRDGSLEWSRAARRHVVLLGISARQVDADLAESRFPLSGPATAATIRARQRTGAAVVQLSAAPASRLLLSGGLRAEARTSRSDAGEDSRTFKFLGPRATAVVRVTDTLSFRTALQTAYRAPTINELYRGFRVGTVETGANSGLRPERAAGGEAAIMVSRGAAAARVVAFYTVLTDPIVSVTLSSSPSAILRQRRNAGRITASGVELEADLRVRGPIALTMSMAAIDSRFTAGEGLDGLRVPQVPRLQAAGGVRGVWPRASFSLGWRASGSQFDDDRNTFVLRKASALDLRFGWRPAHRVEWFAAVENALDDEQDVARTPLRSVGLPRTARVGVRLSLR